MKKLVLLGGPTGVGKTTTLRALQGRFQSGALLDADDVWRVGVTLAVPKNRHIAIRNVAQTMRGYFQAGCTLGVVSWVFARSELYQPVIDALSDEVDTVQQLYLLADPEILETRLRERGDSDKVEYALSRLELIEALPFTKLDTSHLTPDQVADHVCQEITQ
ncbi:MAG: hypothetical protein AAF438_17100 [Pseudomonadota bacterium]